MENSNKNYGLMTPKGIARLKSEHNGDDRDCCGEYSCELTSDKDCPVFMLDSLDQLQRVMTDSPEWYNSDFEKPNWGEFKQKDLRPVEIVTEYKPVDLKPIPCVKGIWDTFSIGASSARRYSNNPDLPKKMYVAGICKGDYKDWEQYIGGKIAWGSTYQMRILVGAGNIPEDYADAVEEPGMVLVCEEGFVY